MKWPEYSYLLLSSTYKFGMVRSEKQNMKFSFQIQVARKK